MPAGRPLESSQTADVVIVGGGVIGLSIGRALAKRGVRNVIVVEKNEFGREASWAAGGILAPQVEADEDDDFFRIACASRDLYPEFAKALESETGIDVQFDTTGTLYVAFADDEEAEFRARFAWQQSQQLAVEWLDPDGAHKLERLLSQRVRCALRFPNDFQVENRRLVNALLMANERLGVRLIRDCEAIAIRTEKARATGIETT